MAAIIWTDVLQFCVMLAGVAGTLIVIVASVDGGIPGIWEFASANGKTALAAPFPDAGFWGKIKFVFTAETSLLGIVLASVVGRLTTYTCEQSTIQRFQATRSLKDSRQAFIVNALGDTLWTAGLMMVGLALFAYFKGVQPMDSSGNLVPQDQIVIYFMKYQFPLLSGLVVAAVLASGLSAIDAAINAGTSVIMVDFYNRLYQKRPSHAQDLTIEEQHQQVRVSRIITVLFALLGIILAANVHKLGDDLLQIGNRVIQTPTGPLLGMYVLGMFSRRVRSGGAFIGGAVGLATAMYVAFGTRIGFIWPTVFGFGTTVLVGYAASLVISGDVSEEQRQLTWRAVMQRPLPAP